MQELRSAAQNLRHEERSNSQPDRWPLVTFEAALSWAKLVLMPSLLQQQTIPQAPTQVSLPQRPNCIVRYTGDPCDELMQQFNQALEQRHQQEWDNSVAAPLRKQISEQQKQIGDQQNQIKTLQLKLESQTMTAMQSEASNRAALDLVGACLGVGLAFFVAFASFRRLARNSPIFKPDKQTSFRKPAPSLGNR